jgi:hypothetical protein
MAGLAPDAELLDEILVLSQIFTLEVVEKATAVLNLAKKTITAGMILLVSLEVLGEGGDLLGKDCDLNFARTCIAVMTLELTLDCGLIDLHFYFSCSFYYSASREVVNAGKNKPTLQQLEPPRQGKPPETAADWLVLYQKSV